jgi:hypothetical protein
MKMLRGDRRFIEEIKCYAERSGYLFLKFNSKRKVSYRSKESKSQTTVAEGTLAINI